MNTIPLDRKIAQMLLLGFRGTDPGNALDVIDLIKNDAIGSIILFDYDVALKDGNRNIINPNQTRELISGLQAISDIPLLVAVDQEGGQIARLKPKHGFLTTVSHADLGRIDDYNITLQASAAIAGTLKMLGFNINFAPVVDVNSNPNNPVIAKYGRSFSADPDKVYKHGKAYINGHKFFNIATTAKHFPGHGSSTSDSHLGLVNVTNTWQENELLPYKKLIKDGNLDAIMTAHVFNANLDEKYPATLSKKIITGLLRKKLGFDGVIISDDINMKAITDNFGFAEAVCRAVDAGVDILVFGNNLIYDKEVTAKAIAAVKKMINDGKISAARIDQSVARIIRLKNKLKLCDKDNPHHAAWLDYYAVSDSDTIFSIGDLIV